MMQKTEKIQRLDENRKSIMSLHIAVMLFGFSCSIGAVCGCTGGHRSGRKGGLLLYSAFSQRTIVQKKD